MLELFSDLSPGLNSFHWSVDRIAELYLQYGAMKLSKSRFIRCLTRLKRTVVVSWVSERSNESDKTSWQTEVRSWDSSPWKVSSKISWRLINPIEPSPTLSRIEGSRGKTSFSEVYRKIQPWTNLWRDEISWMISSKAALYLKQFTNLN